LEKLGQHGVTNTTLRDTVLQDPRIVGDSLYNTDFTPSVGFMSSKSEVQKAEEIGIVYDKPRSMLENLKELNPYLEFIYSLMFMDESN